MRYYYALNLSGRQDAQVGRTVFQARYASYDGAFQGALKELDRRQIPYRINQARQICFVDGSVGSEVLGIVMLDATEEEWKFRSLSLSSLKFISEHEWDLVRELLPGADSHIRALQKMLADKEKALGAADTRPSDDLLGREKTS